MNWREVGILYQRELRAAFRERTVVINSILIPVFLFPFVLWAAFTGMMFAQGQTDDFASRILVQAWPGGHGGIRRSFETDERFQLIDSKIYSNPQEAIKNGGLDVAIEFSPVISSNSTAPGNFQVRLTFDESKERSATAKGRVLDALDRYRDDWLKTQAQALGVNGPAWHGFTISTQSIASSKEIGAYIMGMIVPMLFVVMVAMGCFYPAVDAIAGERERNTWETLMSTAATRGSIMLAKYLYVATMGSLAGTLNVIAMLATTKPVFAPLLANAGKAIEFTLPIRAWPILAVAAVLLGGFVAAGMMLFASFARTFKEGQALVGPFYMVILLPAMFLQMPGIEFTSALALVPVVNVNMMVRSAVAGAFPWLQIAITIVVSLALIALLIRIAAYILQLEDFISGSYGGNMFKFLRQRAAGKSSPAAKSS